MRSAAQPFARHLAVASRVATGLLGGYAFTWGFVAFGVAILVALGVDFHEAEVTLMLLALPVFLPLFLCSFAAASLARVWAALAGGAVLMAAAAWALQWALLP
jgi:ABC-type transport system involved in cytochrome c biogenesis permease component